MIKHLIYNFHERDEGGTVSKRIEHKFLFSVIIPIYNVEDYLEEAIESIINQTIGFKDNIQLILVNDGSPDDSGLICEKYESKYPKNIIYIKQENQGVSEARNKGIEFIEGKYTNFLDSDDKWDIDAFEKVFNFFETHYEHIDVVACRLRFFEKKNGFGHALDYKFNKNKVVDIFNEYDNVQLSCASAFMKSSIVKENRFNTAVKYSEDTLFMSEIILKKEKYGIVRDAVYNYRKREEENSAIDNSTKDKSLFTNTIELVRIALFKKSIEKYGSVIRYIQYIVMYDLQWYIGIKTPLTLSEDEKEAYSRNIDYLLSHIEDVVICSQRNMITEKKVYTLKLKYGRDITDEFVFDKSVCLFNNSSLFSLSRSRLFKIVVMEIEGDNLIIEGKISGIIYNENFYVYILTDKHRKIEFEYYDISFLDDSLDDDTLLARGFKATIPLAETNSFKVIATYKDIITSEVNIYFDRFAAINSSHSFSYYHNKKYIIKQKYNDVLIYKYTKEKHLKLEIKYIYQLLKSNQHLVVIARFLYYFAKPFFRKPIWIISDRTNRTNDNGMFFFKYLMENKITKKYKCYFAIDKSADDYKKIKKIGKVLKISSYKYQVLFLLSDKIISSQGDDWVINAFRGKYVFLKDLYKFDFIFLQHGIIKDDLSKWLHKLNKNIRIFVTSAPAEWQSIAFGNYGYTENEVKLTGLPRYDTLSDFSQNKIVFMPTWRADIAKKTNKGSSVRDYDHSFKDSEYFKFYNSLINDERIVKALRENGYTGKFCIHPSFEQQAVDFTENDMIKIDINEVDYQKEFGENKLLITDFSSVVFDFAYLNKPVIYTQYDADTFFSGQVYDKGYFSYEDDGFGPVCYDYESSVTAIVKYVENGCVLEDKYKERIESFYKFFDKNNCQRVYEEIIKIGE